MRGRRGQMYSKTKGVFALLGLISSVSIIGCGAMKYEYGKTVLTSRTADTMTIEKLAKNWEDYHIYYTGPQIAYPWGILFDKKGDGKTLTSDRWDEMLDGKSISWKFKWMSSLWPTTRLSTILGPEPGRDFYGYVYTPFPFVRTRKVDEDTLYVYDLQPVDDRYSDGGIF
jgi:hypothetical protein